MDEEATTAATV
jgi:alanyl-tRNA synthetase